MARYKLSSRSVLFVLLGLYFLLAGHGSAAHAFRLALKQSDQHHSAYNVTASRSVYAAEHHLPFIRSNLIPVASRPLSSSTHAVTSHALIVDSTEKANESSTLLSRVSKPNSTKDLRKVVTKRSTFGNGNMMYEPSYDPFMPRPAAPFDLLPPPGRMFSLEIVNDNRIPSKTRATTRNLAKKVNYPKRDEMVKPRVSKKPYKKKSMERVKPKLTKVEKERRKKKTSLKKKPPKITSLRKLSSMALPRPSAMDASLANVTAPIDPREVQSLKSSPYKIVTSSYRKSKPKRKPEFRERPRDDSSLYNSKYERVKEMKMKSKKSRPESFDNGDLDRDDEWSSENLIPTRPRSSGRKESRPRGDDDEDERIMEKKPERVKLRVKSKPKEKTKEKERESSAGVVEKSARKKVSKESEIEKLIKQSLGSLGPKEKMLKAKKKSKKATLDDDDDDEDDDEDDDDEDEGDLKTSVVDDDDDDDDDDLDDDDDDDDEKDDDDDDDDEDVAMIHSFGKNLSGSGSNPEEPVGASAPASSSSSAGSSSAVPATKEEFKKMIVERAKEVSELQKFLEEDGLIKVEIEKRLKEANDNIETLNKKLKKDKKQIKKLKAEIEKATTEIESQEKSTKTYMSPEEAYSNKNRNDTLHKLRSEVKDYTERVYSLKKIVETEEEAIEAYKAKIVKLDKEIKAQKQSGKTSYANFNVAKEELKELKEQKKHLEIEILKTSKEFDGIKVMIAKNGDLELFKLDPSPASSSSGPSITSFAKSFGGKTKGKSEFQNPTATAQDFVNQLPSLSNIIKDYVNTRHYEPAFKPMRKSKTDESYGLDEVERKFLRGEERASEEKDEAESEGRRSRKKTSGDKVVQLGLRYRANPLKATSKASESVNSTEINALKLAINSQEAKFDEIEKKAAAELAEIESLEKFIKENDKKVKKLRTTIEADKRRIDLLTKEQQLANLTAKSAETAKNLTASQDELKKLKEKNGMDTKAADKVEKELEKKKARQAELRSSFVALKKEQEELKFDIEKKLIELRMLETQVLNDQYFDVTVGESLKNIMDEFTDKLVPESPQTVAAPAGESATDTNRDEEFSLVEEDEDAPVTGPVAGLNNAKQPPVESSFQAAGQQPSLNAPVVPTKSASQPVQMSPAAPMNEFIPNQYLESNPLPTSSNLAPTMVQNTVPKMISTVPTVGNPAPESDAQVQPVFIPAAVKFPEFSYSNEALNLIKEHRKLLDEINKQKMEILLEQERIKQEQSRPARPPRPPKKPKKMIVVEEDDDETAPAEEPAVVAPEPAIVQAVQPGEGKSVLPVYMSGLVPNKQTKQMELSSDQLKMMNIPQHDHHLYRHHHRLLNKYEPTKQQQQQQEPAPQPALASAKASSALDAKLNEVLSDSLLPIASQAENSKPSSSSSSSSSSSLPKAVAVSKPASEIDSKQLEARRQVLMKNSEKALKFDYIELARLNYEISFKEEEIAAISSKIKDSSIKIETMQKEKKGVQEEIATKEEKIAGIRKKIQLMSDTMELSKQSIDFLETELRKSEAKAMEMRSVVGAMLSEDELKSAKKKLKENEKKLKKAKASKKQLLELLKEAGAKRAELIDDLVSVEKSIKLANEKIDEFKKQIAQYKEKFE